MKKKIALAVGAAAVVAAVSPSTAQAIVGGAPAKDPGQYSFAGSLQFKKERIAAPADRFNCGVILVADRWAVTPASCVTKFDGDTLPFNDPAAFTVRLGSPRLDSGGVSVNVTAFVKYPGWNVNNGRNDLALLKLANPVTVQQALVAAPSPALPVVQVGWGGDSLDADLSPVLKQASARLLPDTDQRCVQNGLPYFAGEQTCQAADPKRGNGVVCAGDSGSPALQFGVDRRPVVISMNLRGGCQSGGPNRPDVSVNLSHYANWISSVTG